MKAHPRHSHPDTHIIADCRLQDHEDAKPKVNSSSKQQRALLPCMPSAALFSTPATVNSAFQFYRVSFTVHQGDRSMPTLPCHSCSCCPVPSAFADATLDDTLYALCD
jgi:hypothetical protein